MKVNNNDIKTLDNILESGKAEFLEKGFKSASLRNIVKNAGVTTGAFYGYFSGKEALFAALVEDHAKAVMKYFIQAQEDFAQIPKEKQAQSMGATSGDCLNNIIDYAYENYDSIKLLICCSDGTAYENFIHNMVVVEVDSTMRFIDILRETGHIVPEIDREICHMLCSGMFTGMFEMIIHDMPKENAKKYVEQIKTFHEAGWSKIMGL